MVKREFIKTFILCFIALVIGGVAKGLGGLNGFLDVIGFILLMASYIALVVLFSVWYLHIRNFNKICTTSIIHMAIAIAVLIIGSILKVTFICVVSGFFITYHFVSLTVATVNIIQKYLQDLDSGKHVTWEEEEEKEIKSIEKITIN